MSRLTISELMDAAEKAQAEASQIKCPTCGYIYGVGEGMYPFVTYWGDEGPVADQCPGCEIELVITEHVERTWDVKVKTKEDTSD